MWVAAFCFAVALAALIGEGLRTQSVAFGALLAWAAMEAAGLTGRSRSARWAGYALVTVALVVSAIAVFG